MEGGWKTPPPPSATTRQKSPVLIGLNDENVKKMKTEDWKLLVKNTLKRDAFLQLEAQCLANRKTCHLSYDRLKAQDYLFSLEPKCARIIFRTRCRMIDLKINFRKKYGMDMRIL